MNKVIQLTSGRKSIAIQRDEKIESWWYDVVELKLCFEDLQRQFASGNTTEQASRPTGELIKALAATLAESYALPDCTLEMAYQIYYIVNLQFAQLHQSLTQQLQSITAGDLAAPNNAS